MLSSLCRTSVTPIISEFYHKLEPRDQRWIVRIILKGELCQR